MICCICDWIEGCNKIVTKSLNLATLKKNFQTRMHKTGKKEQENKDKTESRKQK